MPNDCSRFSNDYDIILSFPFNVDINPFPKTSKFTYGLMDADEKIYYLNIVNENYVPHQIFCLKFLQELYIRNTSFYEIEPNDNSVYQLPTEIEYFASSLIHLGIYDTTITHLPKQLGELKQLKSLELSNTGLVSLPDTIADLSSLTSLSVPGNNLTSLPTTMINLQSLFQITLKNNIALQSIQPLNGLSFLHILDARHCQIEHLPLDLPHLTNLYMSYNNLTYLTGIQTLGNKTKNKKYFNFDYNHILSIPPNIQHVNNLYWLNLNDNQLKTLPLNMFNIPTLSQLYIRHNCFYRRELEEIINKFSRTNPNLTVYYQSRKKPKHCVL